MGGREHPHCKELDLFLSSRRFDPDYDPWPFHQQQVYYLEAALEAYELKPAFHSAMHRPEARVVAGASGSMVALWDGWMVRYGFVAATVDEAAMRACVNTTRYESRLAYLCHVRGAQQLEEVLSAVFAIL